jgi:hypothetical protein
MVKYKTTFIADSSEESIFQTQFSYNDYYLYSTTTEMMDGKDSTASIGFLGMVY